MSLKLKNQNSTNPRKRRTNPFKNNPENLAKAIDLAKLGHSTRQMAEFFNVNHKTVYKYTYKYLTGFSRPRPIKETISQPIKIVIPQVIELKQPTKKVVLYLDTKTHYINDTGEKVCRGHNYAWYLKKEKLKKAVDKL